MTSANYLHELEEKAFHGIGGEENCRVNSGWCTMPRNLVRALHFAKMKAF
jgi:hypothetical protein